MTKTYLRKQQVAARYATTVRNIDRMAIDGRIPAPAFKNGRVPLWDAAALDASDRAAAVRSQPNRAERDSKTA
jgi:hypothetical protein